MQNTVIARLQCVTLCHASPRVAESFALTKPRVMLLTVFTIFIAMLAPTHVSPLLALIAVAAIAAGAGSSGSAGCRAREV
jgi:protoheme IX farnesyltransferase